MSASSWSERTRSLPDFLIQIKAEPGPEVRGSGTMSLHREDILDSAFARDRAHMVARHLEARGISDPLLLAAMGQVPREAFVPEHLQEFTYEDSALPIEAGQTISQPYIVARMLELAEIKPGDTVLEVGAGSGYAAAVMSRMANRVFAIERHEELAELARARLKRLGYGNVEIICADGTKGWVDEAPYQAIIVSAGGPRVPEALKQQLALGGRLVIPVGEHGYQTLLRVTRTGEDSFEEEDFGAVAFVPLIGEQGWADPERAKEPDQETSHRRAAVRLCRWSASPRAARAHHPQSRQPVDGRGRRAVRRSARALRPRRALRRPQGGPARRGDPWHRGVLSGARPHHRDAGRPPRLQHRRGRSRLARRCGL